MIPETTAAPVIASAAVEDEDDAALVGRLQSGDETVVGRSSSAATSRGCSGWRSRPSVADGHARGHARRVARSVPRRRPIRGQVVVQDVALPHPSQPRPRSAARREEGEQGRPGDALADERFDPNGAVVGIRPSRGPIEPKTDSSPPSSQAASATSFPQIPEAQRQVVVLCDMEGVPPADVVSMLGLTEGNRRVLLHRGRPRWRALLAQEMTRS